MLVLLVTELKPRAGNATCKAFHPGFHARSAYQTSQLTMLPNATLPVRTLILWSLLFCSAGQSTVHQTDLDIRRRTTFFFVFVNRMSVISEDHARRFGRAQRLVHAGDVMNMNVNICINFAGADINAPVRVHADRGAVRVQDQEK